jgi:hypothetical protein
MIVHLKTRDSHEIESRTTSALLTPEDPYATAI